MIRNVLAISLIVSGSLSTILLARELSLIISSLEVGQDRLALLLLFSLLAMCLPLGQFLFSRLIAEKLAEISENKAIQVANNHTRQSAVVDTELIATLSTELGRAQGIFGNNFSTVVSALILFFMSIAYMAYQGSYIFFYLILIFGVTVGALFIGQRYFLQKFGAANRLNAGTASKLANAFIKNIEFFLVAEFQRDYYGFYQTSIHKWLKSIVNIWFVAALSKYFLEFMGVIAFIILLFYFELSLIVESYIILIKLLPGFQALLQFSNGIQTNRVFFGDIFSQLWMSGITAPKPAEGLQFFAPDIDVEEGGVTVVQGASGSGKSTALKRLALSRKDCLYLSEEALDPTIFSWLLRYLSEESSYENEISKEHSALISEILDFDQSGGEFSHGQKQRCIIVYALRSRFRTIIFDELLSGLDADRYSKVVNLIAAFRGEKSVVIVDHSGKLLDMPGLEVRQCAII